MQTVYVRSPELAKELQAKGYKLSKNRSFRVAGAFCFEADHALVELLRSAYNTSDYIIDPLQRYVSKEENE